ncbi:MAG: ImmA/IrrE family metallo-endopeptidase, partial [Vulcanimicrobiota bacterium]
MTLVDVKTDVLEWAVHRSGRDITELEKGAKNLPLWLKGEKKPTFKQLEKFAKATRTPIGFFSLPAPPRETLPIPDMRTLADTVLREPSADLLDIIYQCLQRQTWYERYTRTNGYQPLPFVGSVQLQDSPVVVAQGMRETLGFQLDERAGHANWEVALREFINLIERVGIMVMVSGVVGCNTKRKLDPAEFRGFALADSTAPLIFVNGTDSKSAQMFTLAHELAHLWLGQSALSDATLNRQSDRDIENWCNAVAAEFLVPLAQVPSKVEDSRLYQVLNELTKKFKVSSLVILRRLRDAGALDQGQFWSAFNSELKRIETLNE